MNEEQDKQPEETHSKKLKQGDKFLSVKIAGLPEFFTAFPNAEATPENKKPSYTGMGIGVWVKTKK